MILGIDEVGRGPWAGPLVVGAVVLADEPIEGLADSKKLTARKREVLSEKIISSALATGLGWVYSNELDTVGLAEALRLATRRAIENIHVPYHEIVIDGTINLLKDTPRGRYVTLLPKADALIPAVSAASIIAKVARDGYMKEQDALYPQYGFGSHVGYGTAAHRQAISEYGVTPLHRRSFAPIAKLTGALSETNGYQAEETVAAQLKRAGHRIIERNWRTKYCEIDIISRTSDTLYFTEVKYRATDQQGGGLAAVTETKRRQMQFAAELYLSYLKKTVPARLAAASVTGPSHQMVVESFLELE
jgi:ribonuclease HII